jgi:hypothetical protein
MLEKKDLGAFLNEETSKDMRETKVNTRNEQVKVPGKFRMRVDSKKFKNKDGDIIVTPNLRVKEDNKNLCLDINLYVVDGTPNVPAGSFVYKTLVVAPSEETRKGAGYEKFKTALSITKQTLSALIGKEEIDKASFDSDWYISNVTSDFDEKLNETRHHKMTKDVMVTVESGYYNNKPSINVVSIYPAKDGDASVETVVSPTPAVVDDRLPNFDAPINAADMGTDDVERFV